jgi:hypothetical protein
MSGLSRAWRNKAEVVRRAYTLYGDYKPEEGTSTVLGILAHNCNNQITTISLNYKLRITILQ